VGRLVTGIAGDNETGGLSACAGGGGVGVAVCEWPAQPETKTPATNIADFSNSDLLILVFSAIFGKLASLLCVFHG